MRIMFLNVWNGRMEEFVPYIARNVDRIDVFCFQEAYEETRQKVGPMLSDFQMETAYKKLTEKDDFPMATYVRNGITIVSSQPLLSDIDGVGLGLVTELEVDGKRINLCNFHGTAYPGDKKDTEARLKQTDEILNFFGNISGEKIIGGDFNLDLDTESVKRFKMAGYRDLISENGAPTTRNHEAWRKFPESPQRYSDYVFVSEGLRVVDFIVPKDIVSDHQPMILNIQP